MACVLNWPWTRSWTEPSYSQHSTKWKFSCLQLMKTHIYRWMFVCIYLEQLVNSRNIFCLLLHYFFFFLLQIKCAQDSITKSTIKTFSIYKENVKNDVSSYSGVPTNVNVKYICIYLPLTASVFPKELLSRQHRHRSEPLTT